MGRRRNSLAMDVSPKYVDEELMDDWEIARDTFFVIAELEIYKERLTRPANPHEIRNRNKYPTSIYRTELVLTVTIMEQCL
ncbi:hypothetical protein SAMN05444487_112121 [Marininema mesophilum]|uniref:Uncharacterized protein n=1 Tax=Marininema mesophilum TaxID=1048340 RepID=A0A1H3A4D4_9BACL|nr:hypothetical protein [Marininema mesophilum]SDX24463.1 hypothetical protein SAMN05444487_112121 [Marininema mesophilum]